MASCFNVLRGIKATPCGLVHTDGLRSVCSSSGVGLRSLPKRGGRHKLGRLEKEGHKLRSHKLFKWVETGHLETDADCSNLGASLKGKHSIECSARNGHQSTSHKSISSRENAVGRCNAQAFVGSTFIEETATTLGNLWAGKSIGLLKKAQRLHPKIFATVTLLLLGGHLAGSFADANVQLTILALGVAILGVPHGALDLVTAQGLMREQRWPWAQEWNMALFLAAYVACTTAVVLFWCQHPGVSLMTLLAASAWHFGTNDAQGLLPEKWHWVEVAARGLGPITLPFILHRQETTLLFSHLAPPSAAIHVAQLCTLLAPPTALAIAVTCIHCCLRARLRNKQREENAAHGWDRGSSSADEEFRASQLASALEVLLLGVGCTLAPPLLGFFLAFCTLHSLRHTLAFFADQESPSNSDGLAYVGRAAGLVTAVTLVAALAIFAGLLKHPMVASHVAALQMASVQVIFVGLAALTAPHMILLEISRHRRKHGRRLAS